MILLNMTHFKKLGCICLKGKQVITTLRKVSQPQSWEGNSQTEQNHSVRSQPTTASPAVAKTDVLTDDGRTEWAVEILGDLPGPGLLPCPITASQRQNVI